MATTEPPDRPPGRTVNVRQERIEGGVGVSIGHADTVVQDSGQLWRALGIGGAALFILGAVAFATNIAGVQEGLCRAPGLRAACLGLDLGHLPTPEEDTAWANASGGEECDAFRDYLARWPAGAYAAEALARLSSARSTTETTWSTDNLPLTLTVRGAETFADQPAAQADALSRAKAEATQLCETLQKSQLYQVLDASPTVMSWACTPIAGRWRCGFDGQAVCSLKVGRSQPRERCASSAASP